ncbi:MAG: MltA domain-containing protein [Thalassotalea sp.]|nr:MltA domain-containing protein [Thalassotalea sp.]
MERFKISSLFILLSIFLATTSVFASTLFTRDEQPDFGELINFKTSDLCQVAEASSKYLSEHESDSKAVHAGEVIGHGVSLARVKDTLAFICQTYREDVRAGSNSRLHQQAFLKAHFEFIRWQPDKVTASSIAEKSRNKIKSRLLNKIPEKQLLLTKYYTKLLEGSNVRTEHYNQALYQLPIDEQDLTLTEADKQKDILTRYRYTRQDIINGALLEKQLAKPIVWLTEEALHDVLLQGTGVLSVEGEIRYFNVHRNNGIAYDYAIGKREQARYWYFAEVSSILGYGQEIEDKIVIKPRVTLAGNIKQLGLGKLMLLSFNVDQKPQAHLAILADEGGAFDNNLFQLDFLVDSYRGWEDYYRANKHLPDYANVWLLLKKQSQGKP